MADDELKDAIKTAATKPAAVTADGVQVTAQPLGAMIEADKYARAVEGAKKKTRGLRFFKFKPGGAG